MTINNFELTNDMQKVWDLTLTPGGGHVFVTGKAGSGKTTFLKYLKDNSPKNLIIAAPTGVAAVNAGGVTLHSLFQFPLSPIPPGTELDDDLSKQKRALLRKMEILVIDEISMVRPDIMDAVDWRLRSIRKSDRPFGGVQVIMFGDIYQLPPVIRESDWKLLGPYYKSPYFFSATVWTKTGFEVVELSKVFRQTNQDFIDVLNRLRTYQTTDDDFKMMSVAAGRVFSPEITMKLIHLCALKDEASKINSWMLGTTGLTTYTASSSGKFPESAKPCPDKIQLRPGARVMSLINNLPKGYYNGSLGTVVACQSDEVMVLFDNGVTEVISENKWDNNEYEVRNKQVWSVCVGTYSQIPLIPAWAITIHKSQGLTFDYVNLHISNVFSPGQLYVALSRCRSFDGVTTNMPVSPKMIIPDDYLLEFSDYLKDNNNYYYRGKKIDNDSSNTEDKE